MAFSTINKLFCDFIPQKLKCPRPRNGCGDISCYTGSISERIRYLTEYLLLHVTAGTDIEQIDHSKLGKSEIQDCCGAAAYKIEHNAKAIP